MPTARCSTDSSRRAGGGCNLDPAPTTARQRRTCQTTANAGGGRHEGDTGRTWLGGATG
eukprot:m.94150 g.94150  ORF g.94150 m.94150 type:complete len:59 (-) comp12209_c0_seq3:1332-1508(-)